MKPLMSKPGAERGQSMVELAITFILLLILLSGVIDLGRAFFAFMAMRDAAQEGALFASIYPLDSSGSLNTAAIINRVRNSSNTPIDLTNPDIQVNVSLIGPVACHGNGIRVVVTWTNFPLIFPLWQTFFGGTNTIPLTARVEDTILRPPCK